MVVRISTRLYSRLSFHPGMPGRKLPFLTTAAGRAYLSSISDQEREMILEMLASRDDEDGRLARDGAWVRSLIDETMVRGYAVNLGDWAIEPKFGGIAIPLQHQGGNHCLLERDFPLARRKGARLFGKDRLRLADRSRAN